jgi:hypothetical protein
MTGVKGVVEELIRRRSGSVIATDDQIRHEKQKFGKSGNLYEELQVCYSRSDRSSQNAIKSITNVNRIPSTSYYQDV